MEQTAHTVSASSSSSCVLPASNSNSRHTTASDGVHSQTPTPFKLANEQLSCSPSKRVDLPTAASTNTQPHTSGATIPSSAIPSSSSPTLSCLPWPQSNSPPLPSSSSPKILSRSPHHHHPLNGTNCTTATNTYTHTKTIATTSPPPLSPATLQQEFAAPASSSLAASLSLSPRGTAFASNQIFLPPLFRQGNYHPAFPMPPVIYGRKHPSEFKESRNKGGPAPALLFGGVLPLPGVATNGAGKKRKASAMNGSCGASSSTSPTNSSSGGSCSCSPRAGTGSAEKQSGDRGSNGGGGSSGGGGGGGGGDANSYKELASIPIGPNGELPVVMQHVVTPTATQVCGRAKERAM